jgi:hypothetical protein
MFKKIWGHFSRRVICDNRGIWPALAFLGNPAFWQGVAAVGSAAGGIGSLFGGGDGDSGDINLEDLLVYKQLPDYPEATGARETWWNKLQEWGKQPDYGAISPEWDKIWDLAKNKLTQYYWGGTMDTGLAGKIKASAARRNVSQSPALQNMLTAMGMQEARDVSDLASQEAINKATFAEEGRQNWLTSLMNLTQQKPSYITSAGAVGPAVSSMYESASEGGTGLASIISSLGNLIGGSNGNKGIADLLKSWFNKGQGETSLLSDYGSAKNDDLLWQLQNLG